ncbi:hypothetical protein QE414_001578 [Microbacterium sp. SORGH_AS 344]|nr:hypothetical protein [Microbacterium sp. SORGH_AS_0344]
MGFPAAPEAIAGAEAANVAPTEGWKVDEPDASENGAEEEELKVA